MNDLASTAANLRTKKVSARELTDEALRKIVALNPRINAFLTVDNDGARALARQRDKELAGGVDRGPLHGIPIAHKDLIRTKGVRTTAGSKILAGYVPRHDAEIVTRLTDAGAVSIGKTGLHEFAYGITSNNPHFGSVRNPWDLERSPGGSSGGSAAAIAAGIVLVATGTDTGGSIRIPASFCGIVGLKPTFGRISLRGVLPLGPTQDHLGPMALTVRDCAIAFQAMTGEANNYVAPAGVSLKSIKIGIPQNFFFTEVQEDVLAAVRASFKIAEAAGANLIEFQTPDMEAVRWAAFTTLLSEGSAVLKKFLPRREELGDDVRALVEQGLTIPAVDYIEAQRVRRKIRREFNQLFTQFDCIFTPTVPIAAPKIGQTIVDINGTPEEVRSAATRFTRGMNALGFPAISIPCGFTKAGLPVGLQIVGATGREDVLLRVAAAMEDAMGLKKRTPYFQS